MARANTRTLLSLDRFAQIIGLHPLHLNQVVVGDLAPATTCDQPVVQYSWQDADRVGREEIAQAIADSEQRVKEELGFSVMPDWEVNEPLDLLKGHSPESVAYGMRDSRGYWIGYRPKYGYIIGGGVEDKILIQAALPIVYSDADGDGYFETATMVVATTITDVEQIAVYYPGQGGSDLWEVRPINVSIAGGIATITCRREQLVLPDVMEVFNPRGVDGLDNTQFLTTVDVYRHYHTPSTQVQFVYEEPDSVGFSVQTGFMLVRDSRLGIVTLQPGTWDGTSTFTSDCFTYCHRPDRANLWYYAGDKYGAYNRRMDPKWERVIAYLALAALDRPICSCQGLEAFVSYWREDLALYARSQSSSRSFTVTRKVLDNPLGTTRAAQYAWSFIRKERVIR